MSRKKERHRQKIENIAYPNGVKSSDTNKTWDMSKLSPQEQIAFNEMIQNGLAQGIGFAGFNAFGFPQNQAAPGTQQVENADTIFRNLRWYLVSNFRQVLSQLYVECGLVQTIVDVPVDDALRGGIEIKSKQLDESQIEELQISLDRDDDINTVGQTAKWNRLFGGAGTLILTDQDPELPLDLESLGPDDPLEFRAVDMWELFWDKQNTEGYDPAIQTQDFEFYNYYAEQVHKSRVMRMKGLTAPSFIRPRLRGWGFSVVEILVRSLNQYLKSTDLAFEVLDEFKLDVYKIKNLVNTLFSPNGLNRVKERVQMANWQKNYQNAIVMDAEDDFDHKQLSFTGIAEAMAGIRMQVASDMRMPLTKLFGISAAGFNSGEDDIEVYNGMVESSVRNKIKYDLLRVCEIKCQKLFGFIPDDLSIAFKPLRVLSATDEETVKTQKFTRAFQAWQAGGISTIEFREICNKGNLFDNRLDTDGDVLNPNDPEVMEIVKEGRQDPNDPEDIADPGANREDTRKERAWEYGGIAKGPVKPKRMRATPSDETARETLPAKPMNPREQGKAQKTAPKKAPPAKAQKNSIVVMPKPWTQYERIARIVRNSTEYDKAAYDAEGGDGWIDPAKIEKLMNPGRVDEGLWAKAKEASQKAFGKVKWPFVTWWYKKQGGTFK
jgi:phage-related protein (TIGR01555 family)